MAVSDERSREVLRDAVAVMTALRDGDIPAASAVLKESGDLENLAFTLGCIAARCASERSIKSVALDVVERGE